MQHYKKLLAIALSLFLTVSVLSGCKADIEDEDTSYLCPWAYDVSQEAKSTQQLRYYFMSSEGKVAKDGKPSKWGDCCLIVFPDGQTMLVDCGVTSFGPILVKNLERMGVKMLDYLVITHPHSDHQNGIFHEDNLTKDGLLEKLTVKQVYHRGGSDPEREDSLWVEKVCKERGLQLDVLEKGDELQIGQVRMQVLWPMVGTSETTISSGIPVNNSSIVMRFDYGEHSSLFTGDLYETGERVFLSSLTSAGMVDVDLLKVPHHGHSTSGSDVFLNETSPEIAVATGFANVKDDLRQKYESYGITFLNDRKYGYILVSSDGKEMTYELSRQEELVYETVAEQ